MSSEKEEIIHLLKEFKKTIQSNPHADVKNICLAIDTSIQNLKKETIQGIEISVELSNVTVLVNNSLGFAGLTLNKEQSNAWNNLSIFQDKVKKSERKVMSWLGFIIQ